MYLGAAWRLGYHRSRRRDEFSSARPFPCAAMVRSLGTKTLRRDLTQEEQALKALQVGMDMAEEEIKGGCNLLETGEMGYCQHDIHSGDSGGVFRVVTGADYGVGAAGSTMPA